MRDVKYISETRQHNTHTWPLCNEGHAMIQVRKAQRGLTAG